MYFFKPRTWCLGAAIIFSAGAQAQQPEFQSVYQFAGLEDSSKLASSPFTFGKDGRIYGKTRDSTKAWSLRTDGTDFQLVDLLSNQEAISTFVVNSQGVFITGGNPNDENDLPQSSCPYWYTVWGDDGEPTSYYKYGFIYRFNAQMPPEKLVISESEPVCPSESLTLDSEDNIYFYSDHDGEKLYRISADSSEMTLLRIFSGPDDDSVSPESLFFSNDGQWLYGLAGRGGENSRGYLFRIKPDGSDYSEIYHIGADYRSPTLIEIDGYFFGGFYSGGANRRGALFRMTTDGDDFIILHDFVYDSSDLPNSTGAQANGSLAMGGDGNIYGTGYRGGNNNSGVIYRIKPDEITGEGTGFELLHHFTGDENIDGNYPRGLVAGRDGKLYGSLSNANGGRIYALDIGYVPPGAVISAFSANPGEVEWLGGASETVTLEWEVDNAESCEASGDWSGSRSLIGAEQVIPPREGDNTYTLTCDSGTGLDNAISEQTITVKAVAPPPPVSLTNFSSDGSNLIVGDEITLSWSVENAVTCIASGDWSGNRDATGGSETLTPGYGSNTYTLTCTGQTGDEQSLSVSVEVEEEVIVIESEKSSGGSLSPLVLLSFLLLLLGRVGSIPRGHKH